MSIEDREALQRKIDEGLEKEKRERKKLMKEKKKKERASFFAGFKAFISRGNVVDMAVGVVIGGAFGKIVTGLVNYVINPCIAMITGGISLEQLRTPLGQPLEKTYATLAEATESGLNYFYNKSLGLYEVYENYIEWGLWIQTIIDFLIVAFCIYCVVSAIGKASNAMNKKKIAEKAAADAAAAEAKAAADAAAAAAAAKAAEEEAAFRAAIVKQTELLGEIKELIKK